MFSIGIVVVIASVGILEGIAVGTIFAIAIFVYQYSKIDPVRLAGNGNHFRSRVDRSVAAAAALGSQGDRLSVYRLQGYLFFGSRTQLAERIRARLSVPDSPLTAVVIDDALNEAPGEVRENDHQGRNVDHESGGSKRFLLHRA